MGPVPAGTTNKEEAFPAEWLQQKSVLKPVRKLFAFTRRSGRSAGSKLRLIATKYSCLAPTNENRSKNTRAGLEDPGLIQVASVTALSEGQDPAARRAVLTPRVDISSQTQKQQHLYVEELPSAVLSSSSLSLLSQVAVESPSSNNTFSDPSSQPQDYSTPSSTPFAAQSFPPEQVPDEEFAQLKLKPKEGDETAVSVCLVVTSVPTTPADLGRRFESPVSLSTGSFSRFQPMQTPVPPEDKCTACPPPPADSPVCFEPGHDPATLTWLTSTIAAAQPITGPGSNSTTYEATTKKPPSTGERTQAHSSALPPVLSTSSWTSAASTQPLRVLARVSSSIDFSSTFLMPGENTPKSPASIYSWSAGSPGQRRVSRIPLPPLKTTTNPTPVPSMASSPTQLPPCPPDFKPGNYFTPVAERAAAWAPQEHPPSSDKSSKLSPVQALRISETPTPVRPTSPPKHLPPAANPPLRSSSGASSPLRPSSPSKFSGCLRRWGSGAGSPLGPSSPRAPSSPRMSSPRPASPRTQIEALLRSASGVGSPLRPSSPSQVKSGTGSPANSNSSSKASKRARLSIVSASRTAVAHPVAAPPVIPSTQLPAEVKVQPLLQDSKIPSCPENYIPSPAVSPTVSSATTIPAPFEGVSLVAVGTRGDRKRSAPVFNAECRESDC